MEFNGEMVEKNGKTNVEMRYFLVTILCKLCEITRKCKQKIREKICEKNGFLGDFREMFFKNAEKVNQNLSIIHESVHLDAPPRAPPAPRDALLHFQPQMVQPPAHSK